MAKHVRRSRYSGCAHLWGIVQLQGCLDSEHKHAHFAHHTRSHYIWSRHTWSRLTWSHHTQSHHTPQSHHTVPDSRLFRVRNYSAFRSCRQQWLWMLLRHHSPACKNQIRTSLDCNMSECLVLKISVWVHDLYLGFSLGYISNSFWNDQDFIL